jgi:FtsH-binding integral membrane protein
MNQSAITYEPVFPRIEVRPLLRRVYLWMTFGVLVTTIVALLTVATPALQSLLFTPVVWAALIGEFVLVVVLSAAINKLSPAAAALLFVAYAALVGFTTSAIFFVYTLSNISVDSSRQRRSSGR